jgi:putative ABC transport system substrate-binding protein
MVSRVAVWWDLQRALFDETWMTPLGNAASKLGIAIQEPVQVVDASGIEPAFVVMKRQRADAVLVAIGGPTHRYRDRVAAEALRNRLASVSAFREFTADGGLVSYGPDFVDIGRRAAGYVDKILRGAKPGDLPIELPTRYQLAINTRTAKALGLTIPQSLLLRADEVVH